MKIIKEYQMVNASRCQKMEDNQIFKCFVWAGSIMANASRCRREHRGSILRLSTATLKK